MSNSISTLLTRNLQDVFGENDPARRRAALTHRVRFSSLGKGRGSCKGPIFELSKPSKPIRKTNIDEQNFSRRRGLLKEGPRYETGEIQGCKEIFAYRPANLQIGLAADKARDTKIRRP